jgi:hypothetical protein
MYKPRLYEIQIFLFSGMDIEKDYNENLHKGAKPVIYRNARELRHAETEAEKKLCRFSGTGN